MLSVQIKDRETGNTLFVKTFDSCRVAEDYADKIEDDTRFCKISYNDMRV